ncbi:Fe-S cluster assembly scaffold SufA [Cohaesibacter gelatinilyticus]|uniref:Iron-sulfur cluster assembly protein n=1 Tax=Cohaesibacter gelatinilyticus TaxID=372072 RepID=A0A285NEW1_9HYPH|nr:Fe-S cluster assembly scaffold SufA [Cohaesibacter gelatinilyticus]SNZ07989.1 iron-sulfur cluster assembly protein [Cohaesibacter gelatinilyticus]HAT84668.1 Fe-S cluster assembly scaffold SufA [Hyphomicrobiales bacterium]
MTGRFQVLSITDEAAERIRSIVDGSDDSLQGIRVGVKNGGCAGMEYVLDKVTDPDPKDDLVEDKGVRVYVDPKAVLFLLGTEMGYEVTKFRSGFTFNNPNQSSACGCGDSVSLTPVDPSALEKLREHA